jgi:hypothetical protein
MIRELIFAPSKVQEEQTHRSPFPLARFCHAPDALGTLT